MTDCMSLMTDQKQELYISKVPMFIQVYRARIDDQ